MAIYHESRRLGRCDRCYKQSRPNRALCASCAKKHQRLILLGQWKRLGIQFTHEDYDRLFKEQRGCCAVCRNLAHRRLHVDHDHKTLVVRGLLCGNCNHGIGMFKDSPDILRHAAEYVAKSHLTIVEQPLL